MELLNLTEAARELRIAPTTLRRKIKARQIPFRKIGKKFFLTSDDLKECIEVFPKEGGNHDGK
jgi:excisionase family DNA binding protein